MQSIFTHSHIHTKLWQKVQLFFEMCKFSSKKNGRNGFRAGNYIALE